jgi:hypothetical protein
VDNDVRLPELTEMIDDTTVPIDDTTVVGTDGSATGRLPETGSGERTGHLLVVAFLCCALGTGSIVMSRRRL